MIEYRVDLDKLRELKKKSDQAKEDLDEYLKWAVEHGTPYTTLGRVLGYTEAAIRLKGYRKGWTRGHAGAVRR